MNEINKLKKRLDESGATIVDIFPGDKPSTPEEIAREINHALDQVEAGNVIRHTTFPESGSQINVREFVKQFEWVATKRPHAFFPWIMVPCWKLVEKESKDND